MSIKIRYRALLLTTPDLTETGKLCFSDAILPKKEEHRHSQSSLAMPVFF
jgi:hypothetical protein